jgi:hypothetical protein
MNYNLINAARKALTPVWAIAQSRGRCWGPKRENNPQSGSNINFFIGKYSVAVCQHGDKIAIYTYVRVEDSKALPIVALIAGLLRKAGIPLEEDNIIAAKKDKMPQEPFYMWGCEKCKKRGTIEYEDGDDPMVVAGHIYKDHSSASPGCAHSNVWIIDHNMVEQKEFTRYISLTKIPG